MHEKNSSLYFHFSIQEDWLEKKINLFIYITFLKTTTTTTKTIKVFSTWDGFNSFSLIKWSFLSWVDSTQLNDLMHSNTSYLSKIKPHKYLTIKSTWTKVPVYWIYSQIFVLEINDHKDPGLHGFWTQYFVLSRRGVRVKADCLKKDLSL